MNSPQERTERKVALYEIPKILETARVLEGSVLAPYQDSVKSTYNSPKARETLSKFGKFEGELTGSNPFMLTHLQNSRLLGKDRLATRQDLETALRFGLPLLGNYVDFGLALRTEGDSYCPNDLLAKTLAEQLKARGVKLGKGKLIPFSALKLKESSDSAYGLVFDLKEDVQTAQDLTEFKWDYQKPNGLAGAFLIGGGYWYSDVEDLAYSGGYGRVVVVSSSAEGATPKILEDRLAEL